MISKWTEKRHLILQNSDLDFYIASNGVALKADFEKSYFLPTVQIKDEKNLEFSETFIWAFEFLKCPYKTYLAIHKSL